jgi:hypothetical protein
MTGICRWSRPDYRIFSMISWETDRNGKSAGDLSSEVRCAQAVHPSEMNPRRESTIERAVRRMIVDAC